MRKVYKNRDEEAVSPVIATILMVAITVVLAAVLYVMVINMGDTGEITEPLGLNDAGRTTTSFTILVSSAPNGAMVQGTVFSFTHDNAIAPITGAVVYSASGVQVAWYNTSWEYSASTNADTLEFAPGMKITITVAAVSAGDEITISSTEEYFSTTTYTV